MSDFSKKSDYDTHVKEHVKDVLLQCDRFGIPAFMTFAVENSEKGTNYITEMNSAGANGIKLKDDRIAKHALVEAGFEVVPKQTAAAYQEVMEVVKD